MEFTTERTHVRPFQEQDIRLFMAYRNDLQWMRFQGFKGLSYDEYVASLLHEFVMTNGGQLAVIHTETRQLIGDLYVVKESDAYWIGYTVSPHVARLGYGSEIVKGAIKYLQERGGKVFLAETHVDNIASRNLLTKLQFELHKTEESSHIYQYVVKER